MITCGLDECGRGPLAGPIVGAATILNDQCPIPNLKDSKKLSAGQRNKLFTQLFQSGATIAIETISVRQINIRGIGWANKEIFKRLIRKMPADKYIVDGNLKISVQKLGSSVQSMVKADTRIPQVMAASIVAKVVRDQHMVKLHDKHDVYGWKSNKGYGTRYHIQALRECGATKHHRTIFVTTALQPHP